MTRFSTSLVLVPLFAVPFAGALRAQFVPSVLYQHTQPSMVSLSQGVLGLGDINADGHGDYAFTAPQVGEVRAYSGRTGLELWRYTSAVQDLGSAIVRIPDRDQDLLEDILVGDPGYNAGAGRAILISARTGGFLGQIAVSSPGDGLGYSLSSAGDVNADGTPDFILGAPDHPNGTNWGKVSVISGVDLTTVIAQYFGYFAGQRLGQAVLGAGYLDNDAYADFLIGDQNAGTAGEVRAYSGRFRFLLYTLTVPTQIGYRGLGTTLLRPGDLDGDGDEDLLAGVFASGNGGVEAFDLRTGAFLYHVYGGGSGNIGFALAAYGDFDGDGGADWLAGKLGNRTVMLFSGVTQQVLGAVGCPGCPWSETFGNAISTSDVDGDGRPDLIVGQPGISFQGGPRGQAGWAFSPRRLSVTAVGNAVPITTGGSVQYILDAGAAHAGKFYLFLGSATGWRPGFPFAGQNVPLNIDPYFLITLLYPNSPFMPTSFGPLDAAGVASSRVQIIPGLGPEFIGLTLDHAAMVFCPSGFDCVELVSNARPMTLVL